MSGRITIVWFGVAAMTFGAAHARAEKMSYLDNGSIKIGIDLDQGGTITFLARSDDGKNLINCHDFGRQIQQSYYSGPHPFGKAHPGWKNWPWNPIGSGDVYNHASRILEHSNDGKTLYIKTIPMQWALNNVPGECTFETWITLSGHTATVRNRLINNRPDNTQYPAQAQELPALYTIGKLYRLFSYTGDRPFSDQPLTELHNAGPPWTNWKATENWAALVNDQGWGIGVIQPDIYSFIGGFHDKPNTGGSKDNPTGYIAPVRQEILDHNIVYEYYYRLALGTLDEIRAAATANRIVDTRPDYRFSRDRQHWIYHGVTDAGFPIQGALRLIQGSHDPKMIGPEQWWRADQVPKLYLRAAFRTRGDRAKLLWSVPNNSFSDERRVVFPVKPDGLFHTYEINLASAPGYNGTISGLRLDPTDSIARGDEVKIEFLSWKPN